MSDTIITPARDIPATKRAEDGAPIPLHYNTTPSGSMYSTTPGGSRISYDRSTLLNLANSPLARTPPSGLAFVPGVTKVNQLEGHLAPPQQPLFPGVQHRSMPTQHRESKDNEHKNKSTDNSDQNKDQNDQHDHMFEMDM
ncbi:9211_t:CDS:2 [Paraglomus occultum]|uniref:9211_t:CDS:1 n=1 Tax=Paraglomus occultum TaxID=144539 RepID=A0A9N9BAX3_9GLOM|nr:9211_t:CDS:2 [Paraglomus occultum]